MSYIGSPRRSLSGLQKLFGTQRASFNNYYVRSVEMVVLANKSKTANQSPLSIAPNSPKNDLKSVTPFSLVLERFGTKVDLTKVQNGLDTQQQNNTKESTGTPTKSAQVTEKAKSEKLLDMLQGKSDEKSDGAVQVKETSELKVSSSKSEQKELPLQLNPQITQNITPQELKLLIKDAKKYLKEQIVNSEGFKKSEAAALPKTLKGLVAVAKKFEIDVSKITLEEVKESRVGKELKQNTNIKSVIKPELETQTQKLAQDTSLKPKSNKTVTVDTDAPTLVKEQLKSVKDGVKASKEQVEIPKQQTKVVTQALEPGRATQTQEISKQNVQQEQIKEQVKPSATPLFSAQAKKEISTEEIVTAKSAVQTLTAPKIKSDENLKLLLRTDKSAKTQAGLTPDFSVATARVIAPTLQEQPIANKETLANLLGASESGENTAQSKLDGLSATNKSESLDVKINEAKQMIKYLSNDVKSAIEDYKSPFTRLKVQLNPQRLGEIDLTVVQRGKNLHISLSANNTAINTLAMNVADLRVQLQNSGINNATLNFSNNPQGQDGSASQQQSSHQQQQRRSAQEEYSYSERQEAHEEIVNALEIVVPHYV